MAEKNNTNVVPSNQKENLFLGWLAEHPTIKLIGSLIAIIGGFIGIVSFLTGFTSLPAILASLNNKYYDRFENPLYDGKFDTTLWERGGNAGVLIEQRDGVLVLQTVNVTEEGNIAVFPTKYRTIPFNEFHALEAKLKLSSNMEGLGFVKTQVFTIRDNLNWWLECQIETPREGMADYFCNVEEGAYNGTTPVYAYKSEPVPVNFDQWYLSRMEVNEEHTSVRFYLDYKLVGEYIFKETSKLYFSSLEPELGSWVDPTNKFVGYFDDIRIEVKP